MKPIELLYYIENDIDCNCLNKCPFGETYMCGSHACIHKCKNCFGHFEKPIWDLSKTKGLNFRQGSIYCLKTVKRPPLKFKIMRFAHYIKVKVLDIYHDFITFKKYKMYK